MAEEDVIQIRINNNLIGIVGMEDAMRRAAADRAGKSEDEIKEQLLSVLSRKNYIPRRAANDYAEAFLREFKKFMGEPCDEAPVEGLRVTILGPGCARCDMLEREVREAMAELNLAGELVHITDIREIAKYGVMGTPALVVNEHVTSVGQVPDRNTIKDLLTKSTQIE